MKKEIKEIQVIEEGVVNEVKNNKKGKVIALIGAAAAVVVGGIVIISKKVTGNKAKNIETENENE